MWFEKDHEIMNDLIQINKIEQMIESSVNKVSLKNISAFIHSS
jgi:type III secretory pathway lipoprotein EscJ